MRPCLNSCRSTRSPIGPFGGNPAAVCLLDAPADPAWMQRVAAEMNLAETAFLVPQGDRFGLRWFTPTVEVELCGHATLASAHALWQVGRVPAGTRIAFETASGVLTAEPDGDRIAIELPARPMAVCETPDGLVEALGAAPRAVSAERPGACARQPGGGVLARGRGARAGAALRSAARALTSA